MLFEQQLFLHFLGDYFAQTHWMAVNKVKSWWAAFVHALVYSIPFLYLGGFWAWTVIFGTHLLIDRFSLAKYLIYAKNAITDDRFYPKIGSRVMNSGSAGWGLYVDWLKHDFELNEKNFGFSPQTPMAISFFCYVVTDNTLHILINYLALKFL